MTNSTESPAARAHRWGAELAALGSDELQNARLDTYIVWMLDNCDSHTTIRTMKTLVAEYKVRPEISLLPSFERFSRSVGSIIIAAMSPNRIDDEDPEFMTCYPKESI